MAVFRAQVFYEIVGVGKWTNVYHVDAANLVDADASIVGTLVPQLLPFLHSSGRIVKTLTSSLADDTFIDSSINEAGTSAFTDSRLPLFNSVKVLFDTAGGGRPDYKFLKGWLTEALNDSGQVTPSDADDLDTGLTGAITAMAADDVPLCSEDGSLWSNVSVQPDIQMRQMHRRRRRVVVP